MLLFLHLAYDRAFAHSPTGLEVLEVDGQNQEQDMIQILTSLQAADSAAKYIIKYCELGASYSEQSLSHPPTAAQVQSGKSSLFFQVILIRFLIRSLLSLVLIRNLGMKSDYVLFRNLGNNN
jgi:hypothetical protein